MGTQKVTNNAATAAIIKSKYISKGFSPIQTIG
jgi:hypothetical protein